MPYYEVFGQSAPPNPAVGTLQRALTAHGYELGRIDNRYGQNTHAAVVRAMRDLRRSTGIGTAACQSTCNSQRTRSLGPCAQCLGSFLQSLVAFWPDLSLTQAEIRSIAGSYGSWLPEWIAQHGEGGEGFVAEDIPPGQEPPEPPPLPIVPVDEEPPVEVDVRPGVPRRAGVPWWIIALIFGSVGVAVAVDYARRKEAA
jgi:hypothetical protein